MNRIEPSAVVEAFKELEWTPVRGVARCGDGNAGTCGCALLALAYREWKMNGERRNAREPLYTGQAADVLGLDQDYCQAFADGWDSAGEFAPAPKTRRAEAHADGFTAWKACVEADLVPYGFR